MAQEAAAQDALQALRAEINSVVSSLAALDNSMAAEAAGEAACTRAIQLDGALQLAAIAIRAAAVANQAAAAAVAVNTAP